MLELNLGKLPSWSLRIKYTLVFWNKLEHPAGYTSQQKLHQSAGSTDLGHGNTSAPVKAVPFESPSTNSIFFGSTDSHLFCIPEHKHTEELDVGTKTGKHQIHWSEKEAPGNSQPVQNPPSSFQCRWCPFQRTLVPFFRDSHSTITEKHKAHSQKLSTSALPAWIDVMVKTAFLQDCAIWQPCILACV